MQTYAVLYKLTEQGMKNIKESPARVAAAIKAAEAMGGKVLAVYYTVGEYDLVAIVQGEESNAMALLIAQGIMGNVRTTTMRAFTPEEFAGILAKVP